MGDDGEVLGGLQLAAMPLRIQNKEMARVEALRKSWQREPDLGETFGEFVDTPSYTTYILPMFYKERKFEADYPDKPLFYNRIPGGAHNVPMGHYASPGS